MNLPELQHHAPLLGDDGKILAGWRKLAGASTWVCWRFGPKRPNGKRPKLPLSAVTASGKNWSAPENLTDYIGALRCARVNGWSGVGLVIRRELGIVGLDLDGARFQDDRGKWTRRRWASDVLGDELATYVEVSPSGQGYRAIAIGELAEDVTSNASGVEIYGGQGGRFLTITGQRLPGSPAGPQAAPETIRRALDRAKTHGGKLPEPSALKVDAASQGGLLPALATGELSPMRLINEIALARLDTWVPEALPLAERSAAGVWRVSSESLGRALEEDISLAPKGIQDFGEEKPMTPIDVVVEHLPAEGAIAAASWLLDRLGLAAGFRTILTERGAAFAGRELRDVFAESTTHDAPQWPQGTLPPTIERRARDVATRVGCSAETALATHLAAIAGAAPGSILFDVRSDGSWRVMAQLFVVLVGDSGTRKSPPIEAALAPLFALEARWRRRYESAARAHRRQMTRRGADREDAPTRRRRVVSDTTAEAVVRILDGNPDGLMIYADEVGGFFGRIDKYGKGSRGGSSDSAFWLSAADGRPIFFDRVSDGTSITIARPKLSLMGGIQRGPLAELVGNLTSDGLLQRFALVEMGPVREGVALAPDAAIEKRYARAIELLATFDADGDFVIVGEPGVGDVMAEVERWAVRSANDCEIPDALRSFASKSPSMIARLALLLHLARWADREAARARDPQAGDAFADAIDEADDVLALPPQRPQDPGPIPAATVSSARELFQAFVWPNAARVYGMGSTKGRQELLVVARYILRLVREGRDNFRTREVYRAHEKFADLDGRRRLGDVLAELVDCAWIEREPDGGKRGEGWRINPEVAGLAPGMRAA
jgi:hypothetical protein